MTQSQIDTGKFDPWISDPARYFYFTQNVSAGTYTGKFASDNDAWLLVNGIEVKNNLAGFPSGGGSDPGYHYWTDFSFSTPVDAVVTFKVYNRPLDGYTGNTAGLIVQVPDSGTTMIMLGGALCGIGALRRRLSR